jgi:hypothetical protein
MRFGVRKDERVSQLESKWVGLDREQPSTPTTRREHSELWGTLKTNSQRVARGIVSTTRAEMVAMVAQQSSRGEGIIITIFLI